MEALKVLSKRSKTMEDKIDFEKELKRLEEISSKMENKAISLDESIALYEEGIKITKKLEEALKEAEKKVEAVIEVK